MSHGKVRDFREPNTEAHRPQPVILSQATRSEATVSDEPQPVEVTVHEEVIREGQASVRKPGESDGLEIRARVPQNPKAWEDVKRGDDQ